MHIPIFLKISYKRTYESTIYLLSDLIYIRKFCIYLFIFVIDIVTITSIAVIGPITQFSIMIFIANIINISKVDNNLAIFLYLI